MRKKRNPDSSGIDWNLDDYVMRDITPDRIAVYENVDGQVLIVQGADVVQVGSRDLGELIRRLYWLAFDLGYELPTPPPREPPRLLPFPGGKNKGSGAS